MKPSLEATRSSISPVVAGGRPTPGHAGCGDCPCPLGNFSRVLQQEFIAQLVDRQHVRVCQRMLARQHGHAMSLVGGKWLTSIELFGAATGRRPGSCRVHCPLRRRVGAGPVPADDLDTRVGSQPVCEPCSFPTGEHIHRPVTRPNRPAPSRDDDGGVARTHQHRALSPGRPADPAARGSPGATSTGSPSCPVFRPVEIRPDLPAQPDSCQRPVQADTAAAASLGQPRYLLNESACAAVNVIAEEPSHRQAQHDWSSRNGKVSHPPSIAAVHPGRHPSASAATRPPRPSMRCDDDGVVDQVYAVDHHRR